MANVWGNKHASPDETKYTCIKTTGGPLIYITVMLLCMNWNTEKEIDEGGHEKQSGSPFYFQTSRSKQGQAEVSPVDRVTGARGSERMPQLRKPGALLLRPACWHCPIAINQPHLTGASSS